MKNLKLFLLLFPLISVSQQKFDSVRTQLTKSKKYEYVYNFENNYAVFRTFKGKMGLIDSIGNVIIKPNYDYIYNNAKLENLYEVGKTINKKYIRGLIDLKENIKVQFEYDDIFYLEKGLFRVTKNNKTGVIDTLNKTILPLKFDFIMNHSGIIYTQSNNIIDIFDFSGKQLSNFKAKDIDYFTANRSIVTLQNYDTFIIDNTGEIILNPVKNHRFEKVIDSDSYIIQNTLTKKKGVISSKGEYQIECKYDDIQPNQSIFIVNDKVKYGLITKKDSILKPLIYDAIHPVNYQEDNLFQNHFLATKGDLQGVLDPFSDKEIIPIRYKAIQTFLNYYIVTNSENKNGLFSENGENIMDEKYAFYNGFENKIFAVRDSKKYLLTIKNKSYSEIEIPVENFVKNTFSVGQISIKKYQIFKNGNQFGVISTENKIVLPCEYDFIENISAQFIVKKNKKYGIVNAQNEVLLEIKYDNYSIMKETIRFEIKNSKDKKYHSISYSLN